MGRMSELSREEQASIVPMYVVGDESTGQVQAGPFPLEEAREAAAGLNEHARTFPCRCLDEGRENCRARFHLAKLRRCRRCGCTDEHACAGGCFWVEDDLCSECNPATKGKAAALAGLGDEILF